MFGYFPSYALGHLISAQLAEAMAADLGAVAGGGCPIEAAIAAGEEGRLRRWLGERVWPLGRSVNGEQLVERVSGQPLSAAPFLRYLGGKVEALQAA